MILQFTQHNMLFTKSWLDLPRLCIQYITSKFDIDNIEILTILLIYYFISILLTKAIFS